MSLLPPYNAERQLVCDVRTFSKAPLFRRLVAELIDGVIPLPFLAGVFPIWLAIPLAYALFADGQGASLGKRLLGLRVVRISPEASRHGMPCNVGRSVLRNGGYILAGLCTLSAFLAPLGALYPVVEGIVVLCRKDGRRLGDLLAGTQVIAATEQAR